MFCPHCHNKIPDGSNICPLCYSNLAGLKAQPAPAVKSVDEQSGEAGAVTRVEAFLDMIDRRQKVGA